VCSIIVHPTAVTLLEISRHGSIPTVAPVNPYTEFAEILRANYQPFKTAFSNGSFDYANSILAHFLAAISSSKIIGRRPFFTSVLIKLHYDIGIV